MKSTSARTGSALLIVLGILSFMVVSAVGLSIRMRASRAPSSYLRRNIAARGLVKAALARAIDELDGVYYSDEDDRDFFGIGGFVGIYDDPYPGCVMDLNAANNPKENGDYWLNRVFMPFGPLALEDGDPEGSFADTVPTLTLEALAYLPPAIMDDVRALARRTRTAMWHSLPYDSGRYAYCAVNVSDLFDINRLRANKARNSSANGRVTLATLCFDEPMGSGSVVDFSKLSGTASDLDKILDEAKSYGMINGKAVPFTSLADFNIAAGAGCKWAPFSDYIGQRGNAHLLGSYLPRAANALFITDTWFPTTNSVAGTTLDLAVDAQPFRDMQSAKNFLDVRNCVSDAGKVLMANLGIGMVCLYDYLDRDSIPLSLALPTTEAVPMVVGVGSPGGIIPSFKPTTEGDEKVGSFQIDNPRAAEDGEPPKLTIKRTCTPLTLESYGQRILVKPLSMYPFKRMFTTGRAKKFKIRGLLKVFLTASDGTMGCRPNDAGENLYPDPQKGDWTTETPIKKNGVVTFVSDEKISIWKSVDKADITKSADVVESEGDQVNLTFSNLEVTMPVLWKIHEEGETQKAKEAYPTKDYLTLDGLKGNPDTLRPIDFNGKVDKDWDDVEANSTLDENAEKGVIKELSLTKEYRLYAALWVQVLDENEKVVDMAPACHRDDNAWLDAGLPDVGGTMGRIFGDGTPLLNFKSDTTVEFNKEIESKMSIPAVFSEWNTLYAVDPRYNHDPGCWFAVKNSSSEPSATELESKIGFRGSSSNWFGQDGRDRDVFMFVSDQEYLQSIGELGFLPALEDMDGNREFLDYDYGDSVDSRAFAERKSPTDIRNKSLFWRTYTAYDQGDGVDPLYGLPYKGKNYVFESGAGGFKLNPYSSDDRVFNAGIVGTPFDYFIASTNENTEVKKTNMQSRNLTLEDMMTKTDKGGPFSFCNDSVCGAKITDDDMSRIATTLADKFHANAGSGAADWLSCWNNLGWQPSASDQINDKNKKFLGEDLSEPLHGVDRKFLYSFWRECFANRQQLFLIFVRAEPSVASVGGVNDRSSSQMGGRAVALVWRDPAAPTYNADKRLKNYRSGGVDEVAVSNARKYSPPHHTRVLFYHQFD